MMGNTDADDDKKIIREVKVPGFWMAEYPVTQQFWMEVLGMQNPSYFQGAQRPVENVSWYDAAAFCNALNVFWELDERYFSDKELQKPLSKAGATSRDKITIHINTQSGGFRLPSEVEWEYAARGNTPFSQGLKYAGSNNLDEVGWYGENSHGQTQPVGLKLPNELGIYDLSGNVWEWCEDLWEDTYVSKPTDVTILVDLIANGGSIYRVLRGGSWDEFAQICQSTSRSKAPITIRINGFGLRVVCPTQSVDLLGLKSP